MHKVSFHVNNVNIDLTANLSPTLVFFLVKKYPNATAKCAFNDIMPDNDCLASFEVYGA